MSKTIGLLTILTVISTGCGGAESETRGQGDGSSDGVEPVTVAFPTSDPYASGFTDEDYPRVIELAQDVYAYEQIHHAGGEVITTVSMFVVTSGGVLVADGQENPTETRLLIETIAGITDQPITQVVVASDHGDHTGGNSVFPSNAVFLMHPTSATTLWPTTGSGGWTGALDVNESTQLDLVEDEQVLELGGREIHVLHLGRAHTGGDLVVYVPQGKVLFMSETYLKGIFPAMRSAYPSEWVAMLERAEAMDVDVYVPGHGIMESPGILHHELVAYRKAVELVIAQATKQHAAGLSFEEAAEVAQFGKLEALSLRDSQVPRAIERVYMELNGELPR